MAARSSVEAVRVHAPGDLRIDTLELPPRAPHEAAVRIAYGGVCGSDVHYWRDGAVGSSVLRAPMILGHEVVGTVSDAAADGSGPAAGTAVAVHPASTCGRCSWCRSGRPQLCTACRYLGSAAQWPHTDGGLVTTLTVASDRLLPLPDGLPLQRAALAEPTAIAWHALGRVGAVGRELSGADVLVVGAGPIGLLVAAVARHRGAASVTVTDVRPGPLRTALRVGADRAVPADGLGAAGLGAAGHAVVVEASGSVPGFGTALRAARRGGVVVAVGQLPQSDVPVPAWLTITNELTVTGSLRMDRELAPALDYLADPAAPVDAIVSHVMDHRDAEAAFALAADADRSGKVLLRFPAG